MPGKVKDRREDPVDLGKKKEKWATHLPIMCSAPPVPYFMQSSQQSHAIGINVMPYCIANETEVQKFK